MRVDHNKLLKEIPQNHLPVFMTVKAISLLFFATTLKMNTQRMKQTESQRLLHEKKKTIISKPKVNTFSWKLFHAWSR